MWSFFLDAWQFNLVLFLISITCFQQFYKLSVKSIRHDGAGTILLLSMAGICSLFLVPFYQLKFPTDPRLWILLIAACALYAITDRVQTTTRRHMEISIFSILTQINTVFMLLYGVIIFKDPLSPAKVVGALVILFANFLLLYKKGRFSLDKYSLITIMSVWLFATAITIDVLISSDFNMAIYIAMTLFVPSVMLGVSERLNWSAVLSEYRHGDRRIFWLTGISWSIAIFSSIRSFQLGSVTTIAPLQSASVLLGVVSAHLFLGEKSHLTKKIFAACLTVLGVYLTVI